MYRAATWVAVCGALVATSASAQVQRSGGGGGAANAQLMMQYQQASTERTQLQSDNAKLKKELDDLKKQLEAATKQAAASKVGVSRDAAQLTAAQAANDRTSKELADSKAKTQEIITKFRETITQMRGVEAERAELQQQLAQSKTSFDKCAERNYQLYQVDNEVLERYAHDGAFSHMARAEPFTRIKHTEIDNYVLEYKERAEELRLKKPDGTPVGPGGLDNFQAGGASHPTGASKPTAPNGATVPTGATAPTSATTPRSATAPAGPSTPNGAVAPTDATAPAGTAVGGNATSTRSTPVSPPATAQPHN